MRIAKEQHQALPATLLQDFAQFAPPAVAARAARVIARAAVAQWMDVPFNVVISNVPGPPVPLYAAGARVEAAYPHGPVLEGAGMNITVMRYQDSVDFGVMEGAQRVWTMPVDFPWSDVGAWPSLAETVPPDQNGNAVRGRVVTVGGTDNVLVSDGPVVAVAGVHDLVVVATPDAVLVVPKADAQRVKQLVAEIEARGWDEVL